MAEASQEASSSGSASVPRPSSSSGAARSEHQSPGGKGKGKNKKGGKATSFWDYRRSQWSMGWFWAAGSWQWSDGLTIIGESESISTILTGSPGTENFSENYYQYFFLYMIFIIQPADGANLVPAIPLASEDSHFAWSPIWSHRKGDRVPIFR